MKDGDITDQRPDRRNNDIAEMREQRRGRGKVRRSKGQSVRRQEEKDCNLHSFISFFKKKICGH